MTAPGAEHDLGRAACLAAEARRRFGPFVHERVNPGADGRDRTGEPLPRDLLAEAAAVGLTGFCLPPEVGGEGRDTFEWGVVVEEVSRLCRDPGLLSAIDVNAGVVQLLVGTGRADLVERYAVPMAAGARVCPPAAYESRDPFDYATTARSAPGGWRLDGSKPFVGGAQFADAFLVYAREEESGDILSFLVERGDDGVCVSGLATAGLRSMGFGTVSMDDVRVPDDRLVAGADGLSAMNAYLRNRRLITACAAVGHLRALVDACVLALRGRRRGGRGVLEHPNVQRTIGELYAAIETSRAVVHGALAATYGRRAGFFDPAATVAKEYVAGQAMRIGLAVMDLQGGQGYMRRHPWERYVRDALGLIGGQGAQELLLIQLGQHAVSEVEQRQVRMEKARRTIAGLTEDAGALAAFASALESGLLDELLTPLTAEEAAARMGAPPEPVGEALRVLAGTGLVRRRGPRFAVSGGLDAILDAGPLRASVASEARLALLRGRDDDDPDVLAARGASSAGWAEALTGTMAAALDGLDDRLNGRGARLLDASGAAGMAVELCRRLPLAGVVAIDARPRAMAAAERSVVAAGLRDRIELRRQGLDALDEVERFDVAWVAADPLSECGLRTGVAALLRSLRAGGWALLLTSTRPAEDLAPMLEQAGFGPVTVVPDPLGGAASVVAGRRVRRGP